ncbi:hypothetical protein N7505_000064 [Penicillium chrysogenum]|uniref:Uncharacterized protein n=1 Tax=Penicillium chrysogenum TaxID=5076 RepID=A0ABQ8WSZ2_PENCH|nr:hypothetical protein N7505_000064 [Penicillium chrysogenum]
MPALANSPKAWRSWYDQLHKLSKSDDVSTTELKQLIDDPPLNSELTKVAAEDMTPTDVSESFCLTEVHGPRHGSFHVHSFSSGQILECASRQTAAAVDDASVAYYAAHPPNFASPSQVCNTTSLEWGPVTYQNKLHKCVGKAD